MELESVYPGWNWNWNLLEQERQSSSREWSKEDNKKFESALAIFDKETPDRWLKVAAMIPGKSVYDVIKQYRELEEDVNDIEAGRVPVPGYIASSFTFELLHHHNHDGSRRRPNTPRPSSDQERKKGVPWTQEEHRRFLMGLLKYGKGDWRNISRNFVVTKTPTQVASHAQKYYIRQKVSSGGKDKRRPSIHDITTLNLAEATATLDDNNNNINKPLSFNESKVQLDWFNHCNDDGSVMVFDPNCDHLQEQDLFDCAFHEAYAKLKIPHFNKEADFGIHAL
ncbi:hypothetical protein HN51_024345 [Arachis hypogaea]|uniref:Putative MYB-related protein 29 n=1 Tax=Arachis hypogaea TaxID=3818 RepID=V5T8J4_ARAHY|nr:transcription factor DIVARICATA isoform X2 [Arachis hypogaea]AHB59615.1 putative MYB-related protein 29 [Arachis hypogaea]QHO27374.1 Transcription factor DIVARICATA [Arachis hypogaea]QHO27375.1 Transcription factor DIVARICATA [Arachis hypogaea]RYR46245.1 hypothetical protein Ahy_A07g031989 [Arachis hypogaea]